MSKDIAVAKIVDNQIIALNQNLMPLFLWCDGDLFKWIQTRAIDRHRPNSRLLKKVLRQTNTDDVNTVLSVNAATITDTYWIKKESLDLSYDDIKFKENPFADLALKGDINSFTKNYDINGGVSAPDHTTVGSFEKCWRLEDGSWWLYKSQNKFELFSELFIYKLGAAMGYNMAQYEIAGDYIKTKDFTNNAQVNFEPAYSLVEDNTDYTYNYKKIAELNPALAKQYIDILVMDTLCSNMDRHTYNYGFLRDTDTGNFISMAPNFDNNIALISRGYSKNPFSKNDVLLSLFIDFIKTNGLTFSLPPLNQKTIEDILSDINLDVDKQYVSDFIMHRYRILYDFQKR